MQSLPWLDISSQSLKKHTKELTLHAHVWINKGVIHLNYISLMEIDKHE